MSPKNKLCLSEFIRAKASLILSKYGKEKHEAICSMCWHIPVFQFPNKKEKP